MVEFVEESIGVPAVLQEKKLQTSVLAAFAQRRRIAEDLGNGANHGQHLVPVDESVETDREVRIGGEAAADAQRKTGFIAPRRLRMTPVRPTSLISGYEHQARHPVSEILNLRGRL